MFDDLDRPRPAYQVRELLRRKAPLEQMIEAKERAIRHVHTMRGLLDKLDSALQPKGTTCATAISSSTDKLITELRTSFQELCYCVSDRRTAEAVGAIGSRPSRTPLTQKPSAAYVRIVPTPRTVSAKPKPKLKPIQKTLPKPKRKATPVENPPTKSIKPELQKTAVVRKIQRKSTDHSRGPLPAGTVLDFHLSKIPTTYRRVLVKDTRAAKTARGEFAAGLATGCAELNIPVPTIDYEEDHFYLEDLASVRKEHDSKGRYWCIGYAVAIFERKKTFPEN